jgi:hypothetical protein
MMYNTLNHWVCRICPLSGIRNNYKTVQGLRLALSKGLNMGVSLLSAEDRHRSGFQNVAFSTYLEFRTVERV